MHELVRRSAEAGGAAMEANRAALALATAMSEARAESAAREGAAQDDKAQAVRRLEALRARLAPVYAAIPRDIKGFDLGLVPHGSPRLFVDMIAYIEPAEAGYRLVQETRGGRRVVAETADDSVLVAEVTRYVARRLVARERALSLEAGDRAARLLPGPEPTTDKLPAAAIAAAQISAAQIHAADVSAADVSAADSFAKVARQLLQPTPGGEPDTRPMAAVPSALMERIAVSDAALTAIQAGAPTRYPSRDPASGGSNGWWLWPTLALLIGVGLGALALYLYATSLAG